MNIGVPKEVRPYEFRVGLTPAYTAMLVAAGHHIFVETGAGVGSGFSDDDYMHVGATKVHSAEEAYGRADIILKFARPTNKEFTYLVEGQTLVGMLHLMSADPHKLEELKAKRITAVALERVQLEDGTLPVLKPLSQIGGRMAAQVAAHIMQNNSGGKGILLGGAPGIPAADVAIIGAGVVGTEAARAFLGQGSHVTLLDRDLSRLQAADVRFDRRVTTLISHAVNIERVCSFADVLVGAILVPGSRAPIIVTRQMVKHMKPRSLIIDLSIDEGGCVETSRPTTHEKSTFLEEGVIHYCVPNMPGVVARTATHAFLSAAWPYIQAMVTEGVLAAAESDPALRCGVVMQAGELQRS
jgi:alanine dehydrogenase